MSSILFRFLPVCHRLMWQFFNNFSGRKIDTNRVYTSFLGPGTPKIEFCMEKSSIFMSEFYFFDRIYYIFLYFLKFSCIFPIFNGYGTIGYGINGYGTIVYGINGYGTIGYGINLNSGSGRVGSVGSAHFCHEPSGRKTNRRSVAERRCSATQWQATRQSARCTGVGSRR